MNIGQLIEVKIEEELESLKEEINQLYGYVENTPCINYGPCGIFAYLFLQEWKKEINLPIHICFVMAKDLEECYHIYVVLPNGKLFDGGIGVHSRDVYRDFILEEMLQYDHQKMEKWSYGLDRTYPRYCPNFDRTKTQNIIRKHIFGLRKVL